MPTFLREYVFRYYGVDWLVTITVFIGVFLLGDKKKLGFVVAMISAVLGLILSVQIKSVANGLASLVLFFLYLRGYWLWKRSA